MSVSLFYSLLQFLLFVFLFQVHCIQYQVLHTFVTVILFQLNGFVEKYQVPEVVQGKLLFQ